MPRKRKKDAPPAPLPNQLAEDFVRADPPVIALLAVSDVATWERLLNPVDPASDACPSALVDALLAIDDAEGWQKRCDLAWGGRAPWDGGSGAQGYYVFRPWFARGVLQHLGSTDLVSLGHRYRAVSQDASGEATTLARELVTRIESFASDGHALLGDALLLLACRLREDGDLEGALVATQRAEDVFTRLGAEDSRVRAVRMRGAALLRCGRIDEAFTVLDGVKDAFPVVVPRIEPRAATAPVDVFAACAAQAESGTDSKPWFDALARLAEQAGHRVAAERAAAGLRRVAEREEASAREIARAVAVAKQEEERRVANLPPPPKEGDLLRIYDTVDEKDGKRVWKWAVYGSFNPVYDATASAEGVEYYCEIQGPFCGYDRHGSQTWEELLSAGPPKDVYMPSSIEAEIRAFAPPRER